MSRSKVSREKSEKQPLIVKRPVPTKAKVKVAHPKTRVTYPRKANVRKPLPRYRPPAPHRSSSRGVRRSSGRRRK